MRSGCVFCEIAHYRAPASIVFADALTMAFLDLRQFHPGHTLVIPRQHFHDVRELNETTGAALMATVSRVTLAVGRAFPQQGISLWNSIGEAAFQEVPHLHIHIHPRILGDDVLRVYPHAPTMPEKDVRDDYAARIRAQLGGEGTAR
jgi:histidine triad (HIT) family protein